ncbi:A disintegrin and metalloproteinase with thrombospondin motifs adt-2-like isoform X2 [Athalia rosae]|uniref:A disintegrin and metalloproteinase with thrombospondin motifs adt-2-like isoform X2 n=1 Tax=Athalia rosae TaxID=37344 RepID=UPI0020349DF0|nr:A disintegrin and metalloproteinase with thrombospondin motifs adt-2-like isoform X2 [Athalia rosae]
MTVAAGTSHSPINIELCHNLTHSNLKLILSKMVLKLIISIWIIALFTGTLGERISEDVQIVLLPIWNSHEKAQIPMSFTVFGQKVELRLRKNDKLLIPDFQVWRHGKDEILKEVPELSRPASCHYLYQDDLVSAAISACHPRSVHGLIFLDNVTLEITPLHDGSSSAFSHRSVKGRSRELLKEPHVVRRTLVSSRIVIHKNIHNRPTVLSNSKYEITTDYDLFSRPAREKGKIVKSLTLELAVFFDEAGYKLFAPFMDRDEEKMRDMLLAYINGVQALYHHPSLGAKIDIALVRLDLMQKQPYDLPHYNGERERLLDSFCNYAQVHNPSGDDHPNHWDMGLYISGLDFYAIESGRKNGVTMGLATVGGICLDKYACVIAELGTTNLFGKPYPSAGFTSVFIAAHEIGHNLGMHHDSTGNACPKDGYIMSPSRETNNDKTLDHLKYIGLPGKHWTAKKQCEVLLRDKDAVIVTLSQACQSLQCKSPHRSGYYFAGPALDGTYCAEGRECRGGDCLPLLQISTVGESTAIIKGGWGGWTEEACHSGCIKGSQGAQVRRRSCNNPLPRNTATGCEGMGYDVSLCRDDGLCTKKRTTASEYGTLKCSEFSKRIPELDSQGSGLQAPHEPGRPWMACAIFCRRKDGSAYYTPRIELNDLGLDPYFPDGTWCHADRDENYYCRQHHCLPDSFRFGRIVSKNDSKQDLNFGPQNARPGKYVVPEELIKYLSLSPNGLPLLTTLSPSSGILLDEGDWTDKDYIELPQPVQEEVLETEGSDVYAANLLDLNVVFPESL